jgi:hypothetical protein
VVLACSPSDLKTRIEVAKAEREMLTKNSGRSEHAQLEKQHRHDPES